MSNGGLTVYTPAGSYCVKLREFKEGNAKYLENPFISEVEEVNQKENGIELKLKNCTHKFENSSFLTALKLNVKAGDTLGGFLDGEEVAVISIVSEKAGCKPSDLDVKVYARKDYIIEPQPVHRHFSYKIINEE
jgi:hypothetical protein